jgi:lipoprotein-anchoring transpeptidase ErfK/SrfK
VFELTVFKKDGTAVLTLNGQYFKRYPIGVGKPEESPSGTYVVRSRVKKPAYRSAEHGEVPFGSPKNILGVYWIALAATGETTETTGLGLHGTWNESSLGRPSDEGRVRFRNADVEELALLLPGGALVNVTE